MPDSVLTNFHDPSWWFSTIVVALLINILSNYLYEWLETMRLKWYARTTTKDLIQRMSLEARIADVAANPAFARAIKVQRRFDLLFIFISASLLWSDLGYAKLEEPNVSNWAIVLLYGSAILPAVGLVVALRTFMHTRRIQKALTRVAERSQGGDHGP